MENQLRNELTPKYRGVYDRAKTGHSPASAIKTNCLRCMCCKTNDIASCENKDCEFHQYRPYQPKSRKNIKHRTGAILHRSPTGQIVKTSKKSGHLLSKVIEVPKSHSGRLRVKIEIGPETESKA